MGATGSAYAVLANMDVGATLKAMITAANSAGSTSATSAASRVIQPAAASSWSITSTILDGSTISGQLLWQATPSLPDSSVNNVQFFVDGVLKSADFVSPYQYGSNGTLNTGTLSQWPHVLGLRAVGNDLSNAFYSAAVVVGNPPKNTQLPVITGPAIQGDKLTTSNGSWQFSPTSFTYQWNRCDLSGGNCSAIGGATRKTYGLTGADVGSTIRSTGSATNQYASTMALSNPTTVVVPNP